MHIRFKRALRGDYGRAKVGDVKLVSKEIGKSLIARGLAEESAAPADEPETEPGAEGEQGEAAPAETPADTKGRSKPAK